MSFQDNLQVRRFTADETSGSSGLTFAIYVHKVVMRGTDGANALVTDLYDEASITGTAKITLKSSITGDTEHQVYVSESFDPPMPFAQLTVDLTGTNNSTDVYYTRA